MFARQARVCVHSCNPSRHTCLAALQLICGYLFSVFSAAQRLADTVSNDSFERGDLYPVRPCRTYPCRLCGGPVSEAEKPLMRATSSGTACSRGRHNSSSCKPDALHLLMRSAGAEGLAGAVAEGERLFHPGKLLSTRVHRLNRPLLLPAGSASQLTLSLKHVLSSKFHKILQVATAVAEEAFSEGVAGIERPDNLEAFLKSKMWTPGDFLGAHFHAVCGHTAARLAT